MRRLIPDPGPTTLEAELEAYRPFDTPHEDRPRVATNMISTLDGRASINGRSKDLGSEADKQFLLGLRNRFDAVMIGGGTMRAEQYGRIINRPESRENREAAGLEPDALAVILSGDLNLPFDAPLFTNGNGRVLIFTNKHSVPETETPVELVTSADRIELSSVLEHLRREEEVRALLCEGGPHIFGQLVSAGLVDDLFLTITPVATGGDAPRILEANLPLHADFELAGLLEADGDLFCRYRSA